MVRIAVVIVVMVVMTVAAAAAVVKWAGAFPAYRGARQLCDEHVSGNSMHIDWQSYAVKDDPKKIVAWYAKQLGVPGDADADTGATKFDDGHDAILTVYPAAKVDAFPSCDQKPKRGERALILVSKAIR